jgi:hypothetical protein
MPALGTRETWFVMIVFNDETTPQVMGDPSGCGAGRAFPGLRSGAVLPRMRCISGVPEGPCAMRIANGPRQADLMFGVRPTWERQSRRTEEESL